MINENSNSFNIKMDLEGIGNSSKIKLDEIIEEVNSINQKYNLKEDLRCSIKLLKRFKLNESLKWNSELLLTLQNSINNTFTQNMNNLYKETENNQPIRFNFSSIILGENKGFSKILPDSLSNKTENKFMHMFKNIKKDEISISDNLVYASTLFDLKEFMKCKHVLIKYAQPKYPTAMFLFYYCEFILLQQRKQEELLDNSELGSKYYNTKEVYKLYQVLKNYDNNDKLNSAPILYLYAIIMKELNMLKEAKNVLVKCLNVFPFLWSAWVELTLISKQNDLIKIIFTEFDDNWMKYFYLTNYLLEKNYEQESINVSMTLLNTFPNSFFLLNSIANSYYLIHEYEASQEYFEKLIILDPYRYENMDTYSNILFIKENYCDLSNLAFKCFQNDKYRPETCCVIGNYYGLKGDHAKAVVNFKRAIKLDYNFLPAWTLMGHEYLEMKSIPAAIECYRSAVDIDPNDYRAWYGLGQTYELHQMYTYAIYYFLNAARAKPNDSRMWTALGSCYEKLDKKCEALKCYEKAIVYKDKEGIALFKMAKLYQSIGDEDRAAICFNENLRKNVNSEESDNVELIESFLFLAKYYKKKGEFKEAYNYILKLKDHEGPEKDEIHSLMKEILNSLSIENQYDF